MTANLVRNQPLQETSPLIKRIVRSRNKLKGFIYETGDWNSFTLKIEKKTTMQTLRKMESEGTIWEKAQKDSRKNGKNIINLGFWKIVCWEKYEDLKTSKYKLRKIVEKNLKYSTRFCLKLSMSGIQKNITRKFLPTSHFKGSMLKCSSTSPRSVWYNFSLSNYPTLPSWSFKNIFKTKKNN